MSRLRPTNQTKNSHKITNKFQNSKFKKKKIMQIIDTLPPPTISMRTLVLHLSSIACLHKNCRFVWTKIFPKIVCLLRRFVAFNSSTNLNIFDYFVFRLISIFPILFLKKFPIFFQFFPIFFQFFFKKKTNFWFCCFLFKFVVNRTIHGPAYRSTGIYIPAMWLVHANTDVPEESWIFLNFFWKKSVLK